jgi:hypothetical protein
MDVGGLGNKAKDALNSEQGEKRSDQALDKAEQLADDKTGGTFDQRSPDGSAEASKEDG